MNKLINVAVNRNSLPATVQFLCVCVRLCEMGEMAARPQSENVKRCDGFANI